MLAAPRPESFPQYPAAWYLYCPVRQLRHGPVSKNVLGRRLVAFQTAKSGVALLDAHCSHLGADLGRGAVVGEAIQCPFHGWQYNVQGECVHMPCGGQVPRFARQRLYPIEIRHGYVFFFNGKTPLFPLPFFLDQQPGDLAPGRVFRFVANCSWYMLASNGFDAAHFQFVHDRKLIGPPVVDTPAEYVRRIRYRSEVIGTSVEDRFLRRFVGDQPEVTIACWGGPLTIVSARFRRAQSYLLVATQPLGPEQTLGEVIVFAPRGKSEVVRRLWQPLSLAARRWLTQAFLQNDLDRLAGIAYSPHTLTFADREMVAFFNWLASLPQESSSRLTPGGAIEADGVQDQAQPLTRESVR